MPSQPFQPSPETLQKYADVLVKYALNSGKGLKAGEVVDCVIPDVAKPLALAIQNTILQAGGHPMMRLMPTGFDRDFFTLANDDQLTFFPENFLKSRVDLVDHNIAIIAKVDPTALADVPPAKIMMARDAKRKYRHWTEVKELAGKFSWTAALWGTPASAAEVGLSEAEYWQQIINACFLDQSDPVAKWRAVEQEMNAIMAKLNVLQIEWVHVVGQDIDLKIKIGANRVWKGGEGKNIPSFEIFTSPDWHGTEGHIFFNQPLYRYGKILKGVSLEFKNGLVTKAIAESGQELLDQMLKSDNANKLGEFSLTDQRFSRITHVMAETLYDENIGGPFGNTHVAIGQAYKDCFRGDPTGKSTEEWDELGFNTSPEHTDIISTTDRTVTATLSDGTERIIYQGGRFMV